MDEEEEWCCSENAPLIKSFYICTCGKSWIWTFNNAGEMYWEEML